MTLLPLRLKLVVLAVLGVLTTMGYLYARWRLAASKAASATAEAERLAATRALERDVAARRGQLAERQRKLREEIAQREGRDFFDQGWGP